MIIEYHRPEKMDEALKLLGRSEPPTLPLGGGTAIRQLVEQDIAVVDLQALGLAGLQVSGKVLKVGATTTLQSLLNTAEIPAALGAAIRHEAAYNMRHMATVAGVLMAADGRSPFAVVMLALGAELTLQPDDSTIPLGEVLPRRKKISAGQIITQITLPTNVTLAYRAVSRTPADVPIICVALAKWPSGRTRLVLGGYGSVPLLAMDGPHPAGAEIAAQDAYRESGDQWASAAYRSDVAKTLTRRCLADLRG